MSKKTGFVLFVISLICTVLWGLCSLLINSYISSHAANTYYPSQYWGGRTFLLCTVLALISLTVGFFLKSKEKKAVVLFILAVLLVVAGFASRAYLKSHKEEMAANKVGFRRMQESTYRVNGLEYKMPSRWRKDLNQTDEFGEYKYHFTYPEISFDRGTILVYGVNCEFTDDDFLGDYSRILSDFFGGPSAYRVLNSEYLLSEKFQFTALKQECTSKIEGKDYYYLMYLVEDRTNEKAYIVSYSQPEEFSVWDRADFDVIIDNMN